ncbi:MAG TPA: GNAT family protein [Mycobacteriales bacterium]|nr:GNAT family protein [Mycobacteriales bacterium]
MLRGELVGLRARRPADVPILHAELYDDVEIRSRSDSRPWRPIPVESAASPFAVDATLGDAAPFSVVTLSDDALVGSALLWGIDSYNRMAHLGVSLFPAARGSGYGADVVAVLCHYGFVVRGLHRLQVDTLADNAAMIAAAENSGFVIEGTLRSTAWVTGRFLDEVILGLLADDWNPRHPAS